MENAKLNVLELLTVESCKEAIANFPAQISEICDRMLQLSKQRKTAPPAEKTLKEFLAGQPGDLIAYLTYQVCKDLEVDFLDVSKSSAACMAIFAANGVASTAQGGTRQKTQALRNLLAAGVVKVVPTEDPVIKKYEDTLLGLDDKEPDMFERIRRYSRYFEALYRDKTGDNMFAYMRGVQSAHDTAMEAIMYSCDRWYEAGCPEKEIPAEKSAGNGIQQEEAPDTGDAQV